MAPRTRPPFRADHVGSLLRPPALLRARADRAAGTITADQLTQAEDDAIREAVAMQEAAGLRSATDGEFRRAEWHTDSRRNPPDGTCPDPGTCPADPTATSLATQPVTNAPPRPHPPPAPTTKLPR
jgi:hypothetical protein